MALFYAAFIICAIHFTRNLFLLARKCSQINQGHSLRGEPVISTNLFNWMVRNWLTIKVIRLMFILKSIGEKVGHFFVFAKFGSQESGFLISDVISWIDCAYLVCECVRSRPRYLSCSCAMCMCEREYLQTIDGWRMALSDSKNKQCINIGHLVAATIVSPCTI